MSKKRGKSSKSQTTRSSQSKVTSRSKKSSSKPPTKTDKSKKSNGVIDMFYIAPRKDRNLYTPGEEFNGNVMISFKREVVPISEVTIVFTGLITVNFKKCSLTKEVLNMKQKCTLDGNFNKRADTRYKFKFEIPSNIPPTLKMDHAAVDYKMHAKATLSNGEARSSLDVTMENPANLNKWPESKIESAVAKMVTLSPKGYEDADVILGTSKLGYVPGEVFLIRGVILNRDKSKKLKGVKINLVKIETYEASPDSKAKSTVIPYGKNVEFKMEKHEVSEVLLTAPLSDVVYGKECLVNITCEVPSVANYSFVASKLPINIRYVVQVLCNHAKPKDVFEFILGFVPLLSTYKIGPREMSAAIQKQLDAQRHYSFRQSKFTSYSFNH